jgi:hypothetical protein
MAGCNEFYKAILHLGGLAVFFVFVFAAFAAFTTFLAFGLSFAIAFMGKCNTRKKESGRSEHQ